MKSVNYKLLSLLFVSILFVLLYLTINLDFSILSFIMSIRVPKLLGIVIAGVSIGLASIIFQSIIKNRIVTPCLLGMNSLYILIHTALAMFVGMKSVVFTNQLGIFLIDLVVMGLIGTLLYGAIFKMTKHNMLYILLIGTCLTTMFTSISNTITRLMDPNLFDTLLASLVASFDQINFDLIIISVILIITLLTLFNKDLSKLDVLSLGKDNAINLGVDYDKSIRKLMMLTTLLITIATALVGPISFLGLIVTNIAREFFKTYKHFYLLVGTTLVSVVMLLAGQILVEHVFNYGVQISVLLNLSGGVYFLFLIFKNKGMV